MQGDVYKTAVVFTSAFANGEMVTTFDFLQGKDLGGFTEIQLCDELAELVADEFETNYLPLITDEIVLSRVEVFNRDQPQFSGSHIVNLPGTNLASESSSLRVAPVVKKLSGLRGRKFNGRNYLMAPPEDSQNQGVLTVAYRASLVAVITQLLTITEPGGDRDWTLRVYSETDGTSVPVQTIVSNATCGTLRGRQAVFV